jgi:nucleoside-diphosphate-sugar epimerase
MKKILITGAAGQIGTLLTERLRREYGVENIVATNIEAGKNEPLEKDGLFEVMDVRDGKRLLELSKQYKIDTIINLAALLSVVGEKNPSLLWDVNMNGLYNCLEVAHELNLKLFTPSSIAAFGPQTPKDKTPQDTIQRPTSIYGVSKVSGELLCDYYFRKFGVDTRGVRFPGLSSYGSMPGGGTTDYAVHIYHAAVKQGAFTCGLKADTYLDMMYMPDALDAIVQLCEADPSRLIHRNAFNITAMSFCPSEIGAAIQQRKPDFKLDYDIDPMKQAIADSWPNSLDDSCAREEWDWNPKYDLEQMTDDMLGRLEIEYEKK